MTGFDRILLTGGGTAGHVNPALAIGRALGHAATTYLYVGVRGRAEESVVPRAGVPIRFVRASAYPGVRPSLALLTFVMDLVLGTAKALVVVRAFKPDVIVGTGGFAAAPTVLAAAILRKTGLLRAALFIHEQNAAPGKLNLLVGRLADRVFVSFADTLPAFPGNSVHVGYPLRRSISRIDRETARRELDFTIPAGRFVIFAFGGSQGARTINRAVVDALRFLLPYRDHVFVVHGTGLSTSAAYDAERDTAERLAQSYTEDERQAIAQFYVAKSYFHDIERVYALTDLAVVRAGAGTLNEVAALGLPAIVVPKSNLPGEHQVMNARALSRTGGAVVLYEETLVDGERLVERLDGRVLADTILQLRSDPARLARMGQANRSFAAGDALALITRYVERGLEAPDVVGAGPDLATASALYGTSGVAPDRVASVASELAIESEPAGAANPAGPRPAAGARGDRAIPTNAALLVLLERQLAARRGQYRVEDVIVSGDDRAYFASRAASLLTALSWEVRNLGVKLLGVLQARDKLPPVLALLEDRRPASWLARVCGGDFYQVGFIRRNALTTIARIGVVTPEVEAVLHRALGDPYYEVRAEAAKTIAALQASLDDRARQVLVERLIGNLADRWIEVAAASAEALGRVGSEGAALSALVALQHNRFWMVRAAGLRGLQSLVQRGQAGDLTTLEQEVRRFVLTATDFRPEFTIKAAYGHLLGAMAVRKGGGS